MNHEPPIIHNFNEKKPYIFISYAHVDASKVYPIISRLIQDGFRVWYDDNIGPGSEWAETIANYLKKSAFFVAFLSKAYFKSDNCLDELNQARDLKDTSKCLLLYLEEAQMDDGTKLRYSRVQAIHWYRYDAVRCFHKLYNTPGFAKCNVSGKVPEIAVTPEASDAKSPKKPLIFAVSAAFVILALAAVGLSLFLIQPEKPDDPAVTDAVSENIVSEDALTDAPAQPTQQALTESENSYIIPDSDAVLLEKSDVEKLSLSLRDLNYAKNEIYARHGRKFTSHELQSYFDGQSWYQGTIAPENFDNSMLSSTELKNINLLQDMEFSMNPNGYPLDQ